MTSLIGQCGGRHHACPPQPGLWKIESSVLGKYWKICGNIEKYRKVYGKSMEFRLEHVGKYWNLFRNKREIWENQLQCAKKCSVRLDQEVLVKNMANLRVLVWMICLWCPMISLKGQSQMEMMKSWWCNSNYIYIYISCVGCLTNNWLQRLLKKGGRWCLTPNCRQLGWNSCWPQKTLLVGGCNPKNCSQLRVSSQ